MLQQLSYTISIIKKNQCIAIVYSKGTGFQVLALACFSGLVVCVYERTYSYLDLTSSKAAVLRMLLQIFFGEQMIFKIWRNIRNRISYLHDLI